MQSTVELSGACARKHPSPPPLARSDQEHKFTCKSSCYRLALLHSLSQRFLSLTLFTAAPHNELHAHPHFRVPTTSHRRAAREQARWQPQGSRLAGARSRHLDAVWLVLPARADVIVRLATAKHEAYPPRRSKQRAPCHPRPAHISAMLRARQQGLRPPSILRGGGWRSRVIGVDGASHPMRISMTSVMLGPLYQIRRRAAPRHDTATRRESHPCTQQALTVIELWVAIRRAGAARGEGKAAPAAEARSAPPPFRLLLPAPLRLRRLRRPSSCATAPVGIDTK